jgi:hypothetical protein
MNTNQRIFASLVLSAAFLLPSGARAQLDLPRPSPNARVYQRVGLTDVTIDYSSPGVKGRKIWGALVPFDKQWRAGANTATKITLSGPATICGKDAPAGTFSLFFIPAQKDWTLIINKNADLWGTAAEYDQSLDVLRCAVKTSASPMRERMIFVFSNTTDETSSLDLEWEKLKVSIPIKVATGDQALANIKNTTGNAWRIFANAARYMLDTKKDYDAGLGLIDKSLSLNEDWYNVWVKASLLAAKGNYKDAYALADKANELGKKSQQFFAEADVKKALAEWKNKK